MFRPHVSEKGKAQNTYFFREWLYSKSPHGNSWQLPGCCCFSSRGEVEAPTENKSRASPFCLHLLRIACVFALYLRRCSCSQCVRTTPPILPTWTTGIYAAVEWKQRSDGVITRNVAAAGKIITCNIRQTSHTDRQGCDASYTARRHLFPLKIFIRKQRRWILVMWVIEEKKSLE